MERGKSKRPFSSGIARNRTAKNGRTCPPKVSYLTNAYSLDNNYDSRIETLQKY